MRSDKTIGKSPSRRRTAKLMASGAVVLSLLSAGTGAASASIHPRASATLTLSTPFGPIDGYPLLWIRDSANDTATFTVYAAGLTGHPVAQLWADWFPFKAAPVLVESSALTLSSGRAKVVFERYPTSETKYFVRIVASSLPNAAVLATTATVAVYAQGVWKATNGAQACSRPICKETFNLQGYYNPAAAADEAGEYLYSYLGYTLSSTGQPGPVTQLKRYPFTVTKSYDSTTGLVKATVSFSFKIGTDGYNWNWVTCRLDSVTVDGEGIPGTHLCGDATLPNPIPNSDYLG
jgi:hypothetical protein